MICSKFLIHWIDQNSKKFIHLFLYLVLEILSYFLLTHSWRFQWMEFVPTMLISNHKTEAFNSITTFNIFFPPPQTQLSFLLLYSLSLHLKQNAIICNIFHFSFSVRLILECKKPHEWLYMLTTLARWKLMSLLFFFCSF